MLTSIQDGTTAVSYAAQYGHSDIVSLLIKAKADINLPDKVIFSFIQGIHMHFHLCQYREWQINYIRPLPVGYSFLY